MHASIIDCHTHTNFSDGESSFEENVRAAAAKGCHVLVSTDHLTLPASMDPRCECQVSARDLPAHQAAFDAARELAAQIAPDMDFIFGFECDWYPGCERNVAQWAQNAQVKLGSVHWIGDAGDTSIAAGERGVRRCVVCRVRKPPRLRFDGPPRSAYALFARWMVGTHERRKPLGRNGRVRARHESPHRAVYRVASQRAA